MYISTKFCLKKEFLNGRPSSIYLFIIRYNLNFFSLSEWGLFTTVTVEFLELLLHWLPDHKFWFLNTSFFLTLKFYHLSSSTDLPNLSIADPRCCTSLFFWAPSGTVLPSVPSCPNPRGYQRCRVWANKDADKIKCWWFLTVWWGGKPPVYICLSLCKMFYWILGWAKKACNSWSHGSRDHIVALKILLPGCILLHCFQSIVLTPCDLPAVLKYTLQSKRFHRCQSTVERFLPRTAEGIAIARCLLARG